MALLAALPGVAAEGGIPAPLEAREEGPTLTVRAARMIEPATECVIPDPLVVIRGDRIVAAGPSASTDAPDDARGVTLDDATRTPGFIDAHVHLTGGQEPYYEGLFTDGLAGSGR